MGVCEKKDGHDLICLLKEIRNILDDEVYDFLLRLSSFIYYNEKTDASFSRYLVNHNLEFYNLNKITIYYIIVIWKIIFLNFIQLWTMFFQQ